MIVENEKMENLLNLALDATPEEREKSLELSVGYDRTERTWEVIVKTGADEETLQPLSSSPREPARGSGL